MVNSGKWALAAKTYMRQLGIEQVGIGTNEHLEKMSTLGPMGIWDKWALRACGDRDKWIFGGKGTLEQRGV